MRLTAARLEWNRIENNARNTLRDDDVDDNYCKCSSEQWWTNYCAPHRSTYERHSTEFVF